MSVALESAPVDDATLAAARDGVREALTAAPRYAELPPGERRTIANSLVRIAHAAGVLSAVSDAPAAPPQSTGPSNDIIALIEKLRQLRDAGVLTEDEFAGKKAELLQRL